MTCAGRVTFLCSLGRSARCHAGVHREPDAVCDCACVHCVQGQGGGCRHPQGHLVAGPNAPCSPPQPFDQEQTGKPRTVAAIHTDGLSIFEGMYPAKIPETDAKRIIVSRCGATFAATWAHIRLARTLALLRQRGSMPSSTTSCRPRSSPPVELDTRSADRH
jgi:hypothetical protein